MSIGVVELTLEPGVGSPFREIQVAEDRFQIEHEGPGTEKRNLRYFIAHAGLHHRNAGRAKRLTPPSHLALSLHGKPVYFHFATSAGPLVFFEVSFHGSAMC